MPYLGTSIYPHYTTGMKIHENIVKIHESRVKKSWKYSENKRKYSENSWNSVNSMNLITSH